MRNETLMTEGCIWQHLIRFAVPLFLGNLFQQLYHVADSLVVGNFCGDQALAAVSSSNSLCYLLIGFFQGVFAGASVVVSRRYGAGDREGVDKAIYTTVVFAVAAGILLTVFGVAFTPAILRLMGTPESVLPSSVVYFRIYCAGLLSLVLYNTSNGIFQAMGDSRHPLYYLIISSVTNVLLDLLFVAVMDMGVAGAALATVLGQTLSAALGFLHLFSGRFIVKLRFRSLRCDPSTLKSVVLLGLPSGVQNCMISLANVVVQTNINAFGDAAMAGCGSYSRIEGFVFLPISSLTMALTTFISQNLGAGRQDRAEQGARTGIIMAVAVAQLVGILYFLLAPQAIGLFSKSPEVMAFGIRQARTEALFYGLLAYAHSAVAILRGAGCPVAPMAIMLGIWCLLRISYITLMVRLFETITVVFTAYPVTWGISCVLFACCLRRKDYWLHHGQQSL